MASSPIFLVVHFRVKSAEVDSAKALFTTHEKNGKTDQGNLEFQVFQDTDDPTRFTSFESWENQAAIDAHDATDHHAEFIERLTAIQSEEKRVQVLSRF